VVSGQESPEWQGWKTVAEHRQGEYAPAPAVVYALSARGPVRLVTCLYPARPGEVCPLQAVAAGSGVDETGVRLVLRDGTQLDLDEGMWGRGS
jgi:hypothetical protein